MPNLEYFKDIPPFPIDTQIADIPIIFLKALQDDPLGSHDIFEASIDHGFFMLDLRGSEIGEKLLKDAEAMFDISRATFDLAQETLLKYVCHPPRDLRGYKPAGTLKTSAGKVDAIEVYTMNQDDILGTCTTTTPPYSNPAPIQNREEEIRSFFHHAHQILLVIFAQLDKRLGLPPRTLASLCPLDKLSASALRMLLTRPRPRSFTDTDTDVPMMTTTTDLQDISNTNRVAFAGHTDIGLITLLFHVLGGLQIRPAGIENKNIPSNWRYVKPQPGCVMVQMADSLVQLTGGVVRSALHRVVTPPGEQALLPRRSLAYLVRVEDRASMRKLKGEGQGGVILGLAEGEVDETRSPAEWRWRG